MPAARRPAALLPLLLLAALTLSAGTAQAAPSISVHGYEDAGGGYHPVGEGGSIPNGSTLRIRVYIDLYSCGSVRVGWGDGTPAQTRNYGWALVLDWSHQYNKEGTFGIVATDCDGSDGASIRVGGGGLGAFGLGPLDPDSALFAPTIIGLVLGLVGLALANARPAVPALPPAPPGSGRPSWWKSLQPGIPASRAQHVVSLRDIPLGAPRQREPRIEMKPGEPTDPFQKQVCQCGSPLGYTVAGWFCLNPKCPLIDRADSTLFPEVGEPYGPPPLQPPKV